MSEIEWSDQEHNHSKIKLQILLMGSIYNDAEKDEQQSRGSFTNAYVTSLKTYFVWIRKNLQC